MKIRTKPQNEGSVLLVSLLTASVIGVALGSYLTLTSNQSLSVFRSSTWNEGIPVSEAGIEEALAQIHTHGITNFSVNGWSWGLDGCYHKKRDVGIGGSYYDVAIKPVDPPVIISTAYVRTPLKPLSALGMILGVTTSEGTSNLYVKRRVQVTTVGRSDTAAGAMIAKGNIDFSGQNVQTDSFDSTDLNYSTDGKYDPAKTKPNGDVRTNAGAGKVDAISVGNADIKGHVVTGPKGVVYVSSGGSVGDLAWVNGGNQGIQPGYQSDDMNMDIPDVKEPFTGNYFTPIGSKKGKIKYDYLLDQDGNYKLDGILSGKILVTGKATLWVTGNVDISNDGFIQVDPGASLKLYVSGATANFGGSGVANPNGSATSFAYYGLPTNTALNITANAAFTGTVYAPQADFHLGGGGTDPYDFVGSCVVNSVKMNGHFHFHYDEALNKLSVTTYVAASWNELDPNTP